MTPLDRIRRVYKLHMPGIPKSVLLALEWHANSRRQAWPGLPLLAAETGFAVRSVRRALRWLEHHRAIATAPRRHTSSLYILTIHHYDPRSQSPPPPDRVAAEPSIEPSRRRRSRLDNLSALGPRCRCGNTSVDHQRGGPCWACLSKAKAGP